ncbi:uncharacterized protein [Watersipora subatra]|uniref:uncharacterized protein n=1 Tax=Watersipora subatra TaxID=2589382 RepID=UPI00355B7636
MLVYVLFGICGWIQGSNANLTVGCPSQVKTRHGIARITCTIEGEPLPNKEDVNWVKKDGHRLNADSSNRDLGYTSTIEEINGRFVVSLEITIFTKYDYDVYTLEAMNADGYYSNETEVVEGPERPQVFCPNRVKSNSGTAKVTCTVRGKPLPNKTNVTWVRRNGGHTFNANSSNEDLGYISTIEEKNGEYVVTLEVTLLTTQSYGTYTLEATNEGGYSYQKIDIIEGDQGVTSSSENLHLEPLPLLLSMLACCILFYHL